MASVYSQEQIAAFLAHIELPEKYLPHNKPPLDLKYLTALHVHTISTIPYDNLTLHYSPTHKISIDPQHAFDKVVTQKRGRGGYCMENSIMFNHVLRALGWDVYTVGVKIRPRTNGVPQGEYIGWVHLVNLVTLPTGETYMLDVGFGGDVATVPVPLVENEPVLNLGTQEIRLVKDWILGQARRTEGSRMWIYQYRNGRDMDWNSFYAFYEGAEFLQEDYEVMNWYTGSNPHSFQTFTCIVIKFLRGKGDDGEEKIVAKRMLVNGTVKENLGGKTKVVRECRTEEERIEAMKEWFGMTFTEEEREGIKGYVTELNGRNAEGLA